MALLRESSTSVTAVAGLVGYTSLGTFSRTVTRIVGEPPST